MDAVQTAQGVAEGNSGAVVTGAAGMTVGGALLRRGHPGLLVLDGVLQVFDSSLQSAINSYLDYVGKMELERLRECPGCAAIPLGP
jgi:hypothetical protein